jgi:hypothetical protein
MAVLPQIALRKVSQPRNVMWPDVLRWNEGKK